jgi:hypothetical protein
MIRNNSKQPLLGKLVASLEERDLSRKRIDEYRRRFNEAGEHALPCPVCFASGNSGALSPMNGGRSSVRGLRQLLFSRSAARLSSRTGWPS